MADKYTNIAALTEFLRKIKVWVSDNFAVKAHSHTFSGTSKTVSVSGTPSGTISVGTGTANYTPSGSISVTPSVNLNTTTINSITGVGSLPTLTFTPNDNTGNLTIAWSQGTLPTKTDNVTVATGVKSATASGSFSGSGVELKFNGNSLSLIGDYKPEGTIS